MEFILHNTETFMQNKSQIKPRQKRHLNHD
nr:MAG TPA: hypothetical protein [Caudoviricetes sp.]